MRYADRNPMLQNLNNPVPNLGVISGKCRLDYFFIAECQANAEGGEAGCYPGGGNDINHDAMPGDSSFGLKCVRSVDVMEGEPNELGIVSLAGICRANYSCHRSMEDQFYWQGFVATESRLTNALNSNTSDPDHGYATIRVGTVSTINNGPFTMYPGMFICWRFPKTDAAGQLEDTQRSGDNQTINLRARGGTPSTQFRPELVPFDYTDFQTQIAGGVAVAAASKNETTTPGICDVPFEQFFVLDGIVDAPAYMPDQETAAGYKYGKLGISFAAIETLAKAGYITVAEPKFDATTGKPTATAAPSLTAVEISTRVERMAAHIGMWSTTYGEQQVIRDILANMYFRELPVSHADGNAARKAFETYANASSQQIAKKWVKKGQLNYEQLCYQKLRVMVSHFDSAALVGSWFSKTSKVIGRCLNVATPTGTREQIRI